MKVVAYFALLTSAVQAAVLTNRPPCPEVCDSSHCPAPPQGCFYGQVKDGCGCCVVCAAGEGEACGGGLSCGGGLRCDALPGKLGGLYSSCVCVTSGPACGSDGRTYPSICRLRAETRRAELSEAPPVFSVQRGRCGSGGLRYKFNFIADVVDTIVPAVVHLELFQSEEESVSSGSGFVVSEDGWIITSAHVLNNKRRIKVQLKSGLQYDATVKDIDHKRDVALIKIETETPLPVLRLGRSSDLRPGEFVVAVGSPFSLQNTVTTGIISAARRHGLELGLSDSDMDFIQTDAPINVSYGNSGGPLVNLDGDVIGINSLKVAAGISFAVPVDRVRQFLSDFYRRVSVNTGQKKKYLGVRMLQLSPSLTAELKQRQSGFPDVSSGVYIYEVIPGTAASRAGMMDHDVIVGINGHPVQTSQEVSAAVQSSAALLVMVRRKDQAVSLTVIPEEMD